MPVAFFSCLMLQYFAWEEDRCGEWAGGGFCDTAGGRFGCCSTYTGAIRGLLFYVDVLFCFSCLTEWDMGRIGL